MRDLLAIAKFLFTFWLLRRSLQEIRT